MAKKKNSTKSQAVTDAKIDADGAAFINLNKEAVRYELLSTDRLVDLIESEENSKALSELNNRAVNGKNPEAIAKLKELIRANKIHLVDHKLTVGPKPSAPVAPQAPARPTGTASKVAESGKPFHTPEQLKEMKEAADKARESGEKAAKEAAAKKALEEAEANARLEAKHAETAKTSTVKIMPKGAPEIRTAPVEKALPSGPKTIGIEAANEFRERAAAVGVDPDTFFRVPRAGMTKKEWDAAKAKFEAINGKVKQLDQLPDTLEARRYRDAWLRSVATTNTAKTRVSYRETRAEEQKAKSKNQKRRESAARIRERTVKATPLLDKKGKITLDDIRKKNFGLVDTRWLDNETNLRSANPNRVQAQQAAAILDLDNSFTNVEGGRPRTLLDDELAQVAEELREASTTQEAKRAFNHAQHFHGKVFSAGFVKESVIDIERTGAVVRENIAAARREARGQTMGTKLGEGTQLFNAEKRAVIGKLKRVTGASSIAQLKVVLRENGIELEAGHATSQKQLLRLLREKDVEKLKELIKTKEKELTKKGTKVSGGSATEPASTVSDDDLVAKGEAAPSKKKTAPKALAGTVTDADMATAAAPSAPGEFVGSANRVANMRDELVHHGVDEKAFLKEFNKQNKTNYTALSQIPGGKEANKSLRTFQIIKEMEAKDSPKSRGEPRPSTTVRAPKPVSPHKAAAAAASSGTVTDEDLVAKGETPTAPRASKTSKATKVTATATGGGGRSAASLATWAETFKRHKVSESEFLAAFNAEHKTAFKSIGEIPRAQNSIMSKTLNGMVAARKKGGTPTVPSAPAAPTAPTAKVKGGRGGVSPPVPAPTPRPTAPTPAPTPAPAVPNPKRKLPWGPAGRTIPKAMAPGGAGLAKNFAAPAIAAHAAKAAGTAAEAEAAAAAKAAAEAAGKASKFAGLGKMLGPLGVAFGVYQILEMLKNNSIDKADDDRLRVLSALGGISGGYNQDLQTRQDLAQQNTMINMAGIQRQQELDAMRRQYTDNQDMNSLIRSNEDLLSTLAMPSQPSMGELMARM